MAIIMVTSHMYSGFRPKKRAGLRVGQENPAKPNKLSQKTLIRVRLCPLILGPFNASSGSKYNSASLSKKARHTEK